MFGMSEGEYKLVDDAVYAHGSRDEGERSVGWVAEDEVVRVESCQSLFADSAAVRCFDD